MFGFHIHENFNHPYTATSIKDFWRRWHISLSTWFKEYLYIPLGGNREGTLKTYRNLMIVFFLTGLWHGASWNFVIWGLFHGTFLVLERIFPIEKILHFRLLKSVYTLLVVIVAWVFFRAETLGSAWAYLNRMFVPYDMESYSKYLSNEFVYVAVLALVSCGFGAMLYRGLFALIGRENWGSAVVRAVNPAFARLLPISAFCCWPAIPIIRLFTSGSDHGEACPYIYAASGAADAGYRFYPFAANLFYTNTEIMDNRPLHEKPVKFTRNYAREFEDYYNDTFAGRKKLFPNTSSCRKN